MKRRAWGAYAPMPFVGAAVLLLLLILLTPALLSIEGSGPGVLTEAELVVDRVAGLNATHFYVRAYGTTVRYSSITVGVASNFSWDGVGNPTWAQLSWTRWWNETEVVVLGFLTSSNPVAVNINATYSSSGGTAYYLGIVAFYLGPGPTGETLYASSPTAGLSVPSASPADNSTLPLPILLVEGTSGGAP